MNRRNEKMNHFAVRQLALTPADRVLEIGFGGGVALPLLIEDAQFVCGLDRSRDVVARAFLAFSGAVQAGRADFRVGSVESLPFESASFEKVCTVNTVYFWKSLDAGFAEIRRVLLPEGRVAVGFLPKQWMDRMGLPGDIFTSRATDEVAAALTKLGFRNVGVQRPEPSTAWNVVVGSR